MEGRLDKMTPAEIERMPGKLHSALLYMKHLLLKQRMRQLNGD